MSYDRDRLRDSGAETVRRDTRRDARNTAPGVLRALGTLRRAGNAALGRLLGTGDPIQTRSRKTMERSVGEDLSNVRVRRDPEATSFAQQVNAQAVTVGDDVLLSADAPKEGTPAFEALFAHEATHVVQQRRAGQTTDDVSTGSSSHEHEAGAMAADVVAGAPAHISSGGATAGIQRQEKNPNVTREQAQAILTAYLQKFADKNGSVQKSAQIELAISKIATNDVGLRLRLDTALAGWKFGRKPAEIARDIARVLPDTLPGERLAHLGALPREEPTTKMGRVGDLVKRTEPGKLPDEMQEKQWQFDREATQVRKGEGAVGPYGVDFARMARIASGLSGALTPPKKPEPEARSYAEVEQAVAKVRADALIPATARGKKPSPDAWADAKELARGAARQLDVAQQQKRDTVDLQLGANYSAVKDLQSILEEVRRIVLLVRDALPHHASAVRFVDVYTGDKRRMRIVLGATQ